MRNIKKKSILVLLIFLCGCKGVPTTDATPRFESSVIDSGKSVVIVGYGEKQMVCKTKIVFQMKMKGMSATLKQVKIKNFSMTRRVNKFFISNRDISEDALFDGEPSIEVVSCSS
jgi:hypothetical protein